MVPRIVLNDSWGIKDRNGSPLSEYLEYLRQWLSHATVRLYDGEMTPVTVVGVAKDYLAELAVTTATPKSGNWRGGPLVIDHKQRRVVVRRGWFMFDIAIKNGIATWVRITSTHGPGVVQGSLEGTVMAVFGSTLFMERLCLRYTGN